MFFLYSLLLAVGIAALLPRFLLDALRHGKYVAGLRERAGALEKLDTGGRPVIWLHCVSVGETQAARPLVEALLEEFPGHALAVSTTTSTGQQVARELFGDRAALVFYFPFDWAWSVRRALESVNPSAALLMETELWPRFMRECRSRDIPVALVNGRLSETSFRRYRLIRFFIRRVVSMLSLAIMQTADDAERISLLGLARERIKVAGNIKFDSEEGLDEQTLTGALRRRFRVDGKRPLIVAASTHAPEERVTLEAFKLLTSMSGAKRPRLMIAPRHPERFAEVASLLEASGLSWTRRTNSPSQADAETDIMLLDTIGELRAVYPLADLVFVGGSIARTGGHNILEPAAAAKCVVTGAHTFHFAAIVRHFLAQEALVQLPDLPEADAPQALAHVLRDLLGDDERRRRIGERARAALEQNRGATARTIHLLSALLTQHDGRSGQRLINKQPLSNNF
jgi:3-deoxy-D-manno-octulosonic-acid transferase